MNNANSLSFKDLVDLVVKLNETINWYWSFYAVSLASLLTFLSSKNFKLTPKEKVGLILVFLGFVLMNGMALYRTGRAASILIEELNFRVQKTATNLSPSTKGFIIDLATQSGNYIWILIHAIVDLVVIFFTATLPSPSKRLLRYPGENFDPE
jgi:hypothetical protein